MSETVKKRKKLGMPSSYGILVICLLAVAAVTWIASAFVPEVSGATFANIIMAPVQGFESAMGVCFFVMILGGFIAMVGKSGALDAGIAALIRKMGGRVELMIPVLMILFGIGGTSFGMLEETVPFYILLGSVTFAAGFDSMVGSLIVLLGAGLGVIGSTINPFAIGVATDSLTALGIEVNQGIVIGAGVLLYIICEGVGIFFVMRYARRVKRDRSASVLTEDEWKASEKAWGGATQQEEAPLSGKQKVVLILFGLSFVVMFLAFIPWESFGIDFFIAGAPADDHAAAWSSFITGVPMGEWYFNECTAWFMLMTIVIGFVAGLPEREIASTFIRGAADLVGTAIVIALARGISVLMAETGFDVWLLTTSANALAGVSAGIFAPASFILYFLLTFLIPSSSGMATLSMPIMGPLTQGLGFAPEIIISIFAAAHGVAVLFAPTNGVIIAGLEAAKTSYTSYMKLIMKFIVFLTIVCMAVLTALMFIL